MPSLSTVYQWMVNTCNAPNIGYSQSYRRGQTVNGITYYDCSSICSKALTVGGFYTSNPWFTTATWHSSYGERAGWQKVDINGQWLPGDIVWRSGHMEMVYSVPGGLLGQGVTMGAHTSNAPLADQVSINDYIGTAAMWEELWRYGEGGTTGYEWISSNEYLNQDQMANNAYCFYSYFYNHAALSAIAGMLGNAQRESAINPGLWQNLDEGNYSLGFGLFQWTPATNITDWMTGKGYEIGDGDGQCEWVLTETTNSGQWIPTTEYPISFEEFLTYTGTPEDAASIFLKNFERAGVEVEEERRQNARYWYDYLQNMTPVPPMDGNIIPGWNTSIYIQWGAIAHTKKRRGINNVYYRTDLITF